MGAINGKAFMERIDNMNSEIWLDGRKVTQKLSAHPAFKGILEEKAALFDLQTNLDLEQLMTFPSPDTGERIGMSYLQPKTKEDLYKRRKMMECWAKASFGMMGRSPDYLNTAVMSLASSASLLTGKKNCFPENIVRLYEEARERDLTFTHTFITPQVNRSQIFLEDAKEPISAKVIARTSEGLVIKGARLLATQGGITDEVLVFGAPKYDKNEAFAFSIPSNTPGLKFIGRESFAGGKSHVDHPLSSRYEEMDCILVFNDVLVPWSRVFFYDNLDAANEFLNSSSFHHFALHQVLIRQIVKTEFLLGIAELIIDTIDIREYTHIQEKMAEIIITLETMKALLDKSENDAIYDNFGGIVPNITPLQVSSNIFSKNYPRFVEIIQLIGASGLVTLPTEAAFQSEIRKDLLQYLQGANKQAVDRNKIFRLAWDLTMSAFGTRQTQYERFFFGDPVRSASSLYRNYALDEHVRSVSSFLQLGNSDDDKPTNQQTI
ncbi:4-hydroxyphenylacetate 3-monooxygenase, oxygenase component [Niallia taxi]|uniref:4-hydroxyphenylacetate 3-monooxygenase, oxygenase component n=1 Tax=Niallia taxi TaxID=2499688 RepID=UPI003008130B